MEKPAMLIERSIPAGETKGAKNKRHIKEKKDLELIIRQRKISNKIGNQWLAELKALQDAEQCVEENVSVDTMLKDLHELNQQNQERAARSMNRLAQQSALAAAMEEYCKTERKDNSRWELEQLTPQFVQQNLKMIQIKADGSCLYSALEHVFKEKNLRERLAEFVETSQEAQKTVKDVFNRDIVEYINGVRGNEWGGDLELSFLSEILNVEVRVFNAFMKPVVYGEGRSRHGAIVFCRYQIAGGAHYNALE